jgi:branched-chain amino acid transport system permease protein
MLHNQALATVDLSLWRWFFFGLTLIVVMVLRPEGLFPSKARQAELHGVQAEAPPAEPPSAPAPEAETADAV